MSITNYYLNYSEYLNHCKTNKKNLLRVKILNAFYDKCEVFLGRHFVYVLQRKLCDGKEKKNVCKNVIVILFNTYRIEIHHFQKISLWNECVCSCVSVICVCVCP